MSQRAPDPAARPGRPRRVALVGAGWIADAHAEVLRELDGVEVSLVCDPDPTRRAALAKKAGAVRSVASVAEIQPGEVDLAHLLVPPALHEQLARELLQKGIGVFAEKPLALSADSARELGRLAASRQLPLGVNHNFRFHPAFVRLLEAVRAGRIGRVEHVHATLATPLAQLEAGSFGHWMFAAPGNILYEQAVHPLSLVHAIVGRLEKAETSLLGTRELLPGRVFHDRWAIGARASGGTAQIHLSFGSPFEQFRVEVRGTDGWLEADLRRNTFSGEGKTEWLEFFDGDVATRERSRMLRSDARRNLWRYLLATLRLSRREDGFFASMRGSIEAFHANVSGGAKDVGSFPGDARSAAEVLEWCDAIARAAGRGSPTASDSPGVLPSPGPARAGEIAVLGASGFIGRRTVEKLLSRNLPVTAVVRRTDGLPAEIALPAADRRVRVVCASLEDPASLASALAGARVVLHLATGGGATWEEVERSMVKGSVAAAEAALKAGAARFVYVSSIAALDTGGTQPIDDSVATDPRPESLNVYARGKIAAERALLELHRSHGLPLVIARPGVVMGAGSPFQHSGLGLWTRDNHCVGWGAGDHPLPLVWVDDVAEALARIAAHSGKELEGKALNLAAAPRLSAREMIVELRRATGRDLHFHARAIPVSYAMELGKWLVKKAGGRAGVQFPSWRDLRARSLRAPIPSRTAREVLAWKPVEEREELLDRAVRVHGRPSA